MRKLLLLALLLYNIITQATRTGNYDYDDMDPNKRHAAIDDRRNWRKKALSMSKPVEEDPRGHNYADKRRYVGDYDVPRYIDEEPKLFGGIERPRDMDTSLQYNRQAPRLYDDEKMNLQQGLKSAEALHNSAYNDKELEKKITMGMNCDRPHERYEACFAGCASVSCDNPRDRLRPCYPFCEPGCICIHPYVRDDRTHKCVLPDECTKGLKGIPDLGDDI